jgi:hypothetical protein
MVNTMHNHQPNNNEVIKCNYSSKVTVACFFIVIDDIQQPNPKIGSKVHTSNLDYVKLDFSYNNSSNLISMSFMDQVHPSYICRMVLKEVHCVMGVCGSLGLCTL